jgi:peptidoglycan/LPS O-acetylase OafA/YrhL
LKPTNAVRADSPNLDFLRSFAVLLVLSSHLFLVTGYATVFGRFDIAIGHLGVLFFFVHTSLVLMLSLERQEATGSAGLAWRFYLRRAFRIFPLSIVLVLLVLAFGIENVGPSMSSLPPKKDLLTILANLTLTQNFLHKASVSDPLWSLPYEVQMYLLFPLFYWFLKKRWSLGTWVIGWLFLLIVSTVVDPRIARFNDLRTVFAIPIFTRYLPCFVPGFLAYQLFKSRREAPRWPSCALPLLLLFFCGVYVLTYNQAVYAPLCLLLGFLLPEIRELQVPTLRRACHLIARYSYGIYLGHTPLIWLVFYRWHGLSAPGKWLLFSVLMVVVPVCFYHALEKPLIDLGNRLAGTRNVGRPTRPGS